VNTSRTQLPHQEQTEEEVQEVPPRDGRREKQREKRRQSKIHDGDEVFEFTIDWLQRNTGNVTELFSIMNNALQQRDQQHERSQKKLQSQQAEIDQLNMKLDMLHTQYAEKNADMQDVERELFVALRANQRAGSMAPSSYRDAKSKALPDPPKFSDNINPTFEDWEKEMLGKFRVNNDHYGDDNMKMAYIFNRTEGAARQHLQPRYLTGEPGEFATADEMIGHLRIIYTDHFKQENALRAYKKRKMKTTERFMDFYTELLQLGGKAKVSPDNYLYDIKEKITIKLREALLPTQSQHHTYEELAKYLTSLDNAGKELDQDKERQAAAVARRRAATPQASRAPYSPAGGQPVPAYVKQEQQSGSCHYCHKPGHFVKDCPTAPKAMIRELEIEELALQHQELVDLSESDDDLGNGST
jgi:hypothetical protein